MICMITSCQNFLFRAAHKKKLELVVVVTAKKPFSAARKKGRNDSYIVTAADEDIKTKKTT